MNSNGDNAFVAGALFGPVHSIVYHIVSGHVRGCYLSSIMDHTYLPFNDINFALHDLHRAGFLEPIDNTFLSWRVNKSFRAKNHCSGEWLETLKAHVQKARKTKLVTSVMSRAKLRASLRKRRRKSKVIMGHKISS